MTLFETEVPDVGRLDARRVAHLPAPTKERFVPLRAGDAIGIATAPAIPR